MLNYSEIEIEKILNQYKNKKIKEKERYDKIKDTQIYRDSSRLRAKNNYILTKDLRADNYQENKVMIKARNSYNYYKKTNNINKFIEKYPDRHEILLISGYLND
tara:strand:+ start:4508 stop:4819 length:312 start_codon:yes stop_codon:yes gene_type:complete